MYIVGQLLDGRGVLLGWGGRWGGACIHVHVNLLGVKCGSSSEEFHVRRPQVVSRRLQHWLGRSWKSLKDFLPAHMVLKCKERGHSTLHASVQQCEFMWCWRSTLKNPDLKRCCEHKTAEKVWKPNSCGCEESTKTQVSCSRNSSFMFFSFCCL